MTRYVVETVTEVEAGSIEEAKQIGPGGTLLQCSAVEREGYVYKDELIDCLDDLLDWMISNRGSGHHEFFTMRTGVAPNEVEVVQRARRLVEGRDEEGG